MVQKSGEHQFMVNILILLFFGFYIHPRWLFGISSIKISIPRSKVTKVTCLKVNPPNPMGIFQPKQIQVDIYNI